MLHVVIPLHAKNYSDDDEKVIKNILKMQIKKRLINNGIIGEYAS